MASGMVPWCNEVWYGCRGVCSSAKEIPDETIQSPLVRIALSGLFMLLG
jgi:hypothetical protein